MHNPYDVLIIGAGTSGIGAACRLAIDCPEKNVCIVERRQAIGGTWDLFRYPGVRSDSDMFTYGYSFRPWNSGKALADGPSIQQYLADTAREYGIDRKIRFGLKTTAMRWSSAEQVWAVTAVAEENGEAQTFHARFIINCTGYFNYDQGFRPHFPDEELFKGRIVHPQHWPEDLDYAGKRVVVIGSGATAVTLVPAMAESAAHVTLLQRSPTYMFSFPRLDRMATLLGRFLPQQLAHDVVQWRYWNQQRVFYKFAQRFPGTARRVLQRLVERQLDGRTDMRHFTPRYNPWDERLCAVADGDLFTAIRAGRVSMATDHIAAFTEHGIRLKSGAELKADIIVTATGLNAQMFGDVAVQVNDTPYAMSDLLTYKGTLLQNLPNMAWIFGYINFSWTLKVDIEATYICRLLKHMDKHRLTAVTPRAPAGEMAEGNILSLLKCGYVKRSAHTLPQQGRHLPWRVLHSYPRDRAMLTKRPIADDALEFTRAVVRPATRDTGAAMAA